MSDIPHPRLIFWETTRGCNLKCIHCRTVPEDKVRMGELDTLQSKELIDSITELGNPLLVLSGGEPLFRQDILELAAHAVDKGLQVALATNGTLITRQVAKDIVSSGIKRVSISLDGAKAETHDRFRGIPGSFNRAMEGFNHLKQEGMAVQFNTTITRNNIEEVEEILELAISSKAVALHIFLLVPVGCGLNISDDFQISPHQYEKLLHWLYNKASENKIELKATCAPHYFRIIQQKQKKEISAMTKGCLAATGICFISSEGEVYPCGYLPLSAGNILKQPLKEIWYQSPLFQNLRNPSLLKGKCGKCEYKYVCSGCRARAYGQTGDYLASEPFCIYEPGRRHPPLPFGKSPSVIQ